MTPELNHKSEEFDDENVTNEMVALTLNEMKFFEGILQRGQHGKTTGCVEAEFRIADNIPVHLRHGVFHEPRRSYRAIVRFSNRNDPSTRDGKGQARGLAIKLLDVEGEWVLKNNPDRTQDFLMVNHPVFPFRDPKAYLALMRQLAHGKLAALYHLIRVDRTAGRIAGEIKGKKVGSPLQITYWSGSPYWLGEALGKTGQSVKYSAVPRLSCPPAKAGLFKRLWSRNYLTSALQDELKARDAIFEFKVQWQTDPVAMPIEDLTVLWTETNENPLTVATLRIPRQVIVGMGIPCVPMSFTAWHALKEHRPIGGMNRLRKKVYETSLEKRKGSTAAV